MQTCSRAIRLTAALLLFTLNITASGSAHAAWPDRPVRIIVPFAAGGPADTVARLLSRGLAQRLGASVVVENKAGAGGNIGTMQAARSPADGYTLVIGYIGPLAINPSLYRKSAFNAADELAPVTLLAVSPLVLVASPTLPASSLQELIALSQTKKDGLSYGSGGVGSANHLGMELLRSATGMKAVHVPYQGVAPATADLLGGQIDVVLNGIQVSLPHVRSGRLKAIAVSTRTRVASLPEVKTLDESGVPGYDVSAWFGLLAPKGAPADVLQKLEQAARETMLDKDAGDALAATGLERKLMGAAEFGKFIAQEQKTWSAIVRASGATAD